MQHLIHLHEPKTGGKSLQDAFRRSLPDEALIFYRQKHPEETERRIQEGGWRVLTGHIHNIPKSAAVALLDLPFWFTVVRDPAQRLISFRNFAVKNREVGWHERLRDLSMHDGLRALVEAQTHYARATHCKSIVWGQAEATMEGALEVVDRRFVLCGALEHLPDLFKVLKDWGLVSPDIALPHTNRTAPTETEDYHFARDLIAESCHEDFRLHAWLLENGPVVQPR